MGGAIKASRSTRTTPPSRQNRDRTTGIAPTKIQRHRLSWCQTLEGEIPAARRSESRTCTRTQSRGPPTGRLRLLKPTGEGRTIRTWLGPENGRRVSSANSSGNSSSAIRELADPLYYSMQGAVLHRSRRASSSFRMYCTSSLKTFEPAAWNEAERPSVSFSPNGVLRRQILYVKPTSPSLSQRTRTWKSWWPDLRTRPHLVWRLCRA